MKLSKWLTAGICLVIVSLSAGLVQAEENAVLKYMNQMARDIHATQQLQSTGNSEVDARGAAFSKEASSFEALKKAISSVSSAGEVQNTIDVLKSYSAKISTNAEGKALQQASQLLKARIKFLAQTENPALKDKINSLESLSHGSLQGIAFSRAQGARPRKPASRSTGRTKGLDLLGAHIQNGKTCFSVYSPEATEVCVVLFNKASDKTGKGYGLKKGTDGIWRITIDGDLTGKFYGFTADGPKGPGYLFDTRRLISDPYAFANIDHDGKSVIIQRDFKWTDQGFKTPAFNDLIIYEMHVKDYTAHSSSGVTGAKKGKYLGLLEGKTTGKVLGNLLELGVNAVELLPVHEYDNNFAGHPNHWGYMTSHFFAPECSLASGKNGEAVRELKETINGLHRNGIAVILDVVFNHTAEGNEKGLPLNFKALDNPGYYRLMADKNLYWNGTGCGNEFRSDNPMTRKYILDSLKYFVKEYHVDGFRFDLGTIIDKQTMGEILTRLPPSTIIVAEPWAADWKRNQWGKSDFRNTKLGKWNDDYREKIRGYINGSGNRNDAMTVIAGSCFWWTAKPTESVNYLACHDGYTINDLFHGDKAKAKMAGAILLTSQGIPMIHEGQEFMKSKKGNHNSYDQDNDINWIDWGVKKKNQDVFDFFKGLVNLRKKYENFKRAAPLTDKEISWLQPSNSKGLGYHLKGTRDFIVLLNCDSSEWIQFQLPDQNDWTVVCNGNKVADSGLGTAKGDYKVPPMTAVILKK